MLYWVAIISFLPFLIYLFVSIRREIRLRHKIKGSQKNNEVLLLRNNVSKLNKVTFLKKQRKQQILFENIVKHQRKKPSPFDTPIYLIKFSRTAAWNTPAYQLSVDPKGTVIYEGNSTVRLQGFYHWKINPKSLQELGLIIHKSNFLELGASSYQSDIDAISKVTIDIHRNDGTQHTVIFDHAADYPIQIGRIERTLDELLGTKKLWLEWRQNIHRLSIKIGSNSQFTFVAFDKLCWYKNGTELRRVETAEWWDALDCIVKKHNTLWIQETTNTFYNHPFDSLWIELDNGFQFLISKHKHPSIYKDFVEIINQESTLNPPFNLQLKS